MTGITTIKFRINSAELFKNSFANDGTNKYYFFIGQVSPWANDSAPTTFETTVRNLEYSFWKDAIGFKKISENSVRLAAPRYNWQNNTFFAQYSDVNSNLYSNNFFVLTDDFNVYKCLFNNNSANSTVKPTGTSTGIIETGDGYKWKYMFNLSSSERSDFLTTNYIPVKTLSANDGSSQWVVQQAASNGSIDVIQVIANGTGYFSNTGSFSSVTNSTALSLATTEKNSNSLYVGSTIFIVSGQGSGQLREIVQYNGTSKLLVVNTNFTVTPNTSSAYHIGPKIQINGDGRSATAYANVSSGQIRKINMINNGLNYSIANVVISANGGSGAQGLVYLSPPGGHGSNPVQELGAKNVILNCTLANTESNTLPSNNEYRVVGIVANPLLANGTSANGSNYDQTTRLTLTSKSGSFVFDETISGGTSGANGIVVNFSNTNTAHTTGVLRITGANNTFILNETITGANSSSTGVINTINQGDLRRNSGELIYVENIVPIIRAPDQSENFKIIIGF